MSKHLPEILKTAKSPFIDSLVIPVVAMKKVEDLANLENIQSEDGTIIATGPVHKISKGFVLEKDRKVHLYFFHINLYY